MKTPAHRRLWLCPCDSKLGFVVSCYGFDFSFERFEHVDDRFRKFFYVFSVFGLFHDPKAGISVDGRYYCIVVKILS